MTAPVVHAAVARRRSDGWLRWGWHCPPCGQGEWVGGKEAAEAAADAHNAPPAELAKVLEFVRTEMRCSCFHAVDVEFDEPCVRCKLMRLLVGGAA